jgi:hypothetical protein
MRNPDEMTLKGASDGSTKTVGSCIVLRFPRPYRTLTPWQRCCSVMLNENDRQALAAQRAQLYARHMAKVVVL